MQTWTFKSKSNPSGKPYTTVLADDGKLLCDCRGWTVRKGDNPRECTHTKQVAAELNRRTIARGEFLFLEADFGPDDIGAVPPTGVDLKPVKERGPREVGGAVVVASSPVYVPPAPMLASAMTEPIIGEEFDHTFGRSGWVMEEKLDGHRCTVVVKDGSVAAFSRPRAGGQQNRRDLPKHIVEQLRHFPDGVYDGELVAPGGKSWDVTTRGAYLILVLFDIIDTGNIYQTRRLMLLDVLARMDARDPNQKAVTTVESVAPSWAGVQAIWARGGEGAILKRVDSMYAPGYRSPDWIKVKELNHEAMQVTGFEEGKCGPYSKIACRDINGHETTVKTLGNAMLRDFAANPASFIGRWFVMAYQIKTPSGSYRHGVFDHWAGPAEVPTAPVPAAPLAIPAATAAPATIAKGQASYAPTTAPKPSADRSAAARKAWETRRAPRTRVDFDADKSADYMNNLPASKVQAITTAR